MKTKIAFLSSVLIIAFIMPMLGQNTENNNTKTGLKKHDMCSMMGKPTFDATSAGLDFRVWLMTQEEHKKIMEEKKDQMRMNENGMNTDHATMEAMMAGTHHIMLDVKEAKSGKEITNASAQLQVLSPSKKNFSVDLTPMMSHFGDGITLSEKGQYQLTVSVIVDGVAKKTSFNYTVK